MKQHGTVSLALGSLKQEGVLAWAVCLLSCEKCTAALRLPLAPGAGGKIAWFSSDWLGEVGDSVVSSGQVGALVHLLRSQKEFSKGWRCWMAGDEKVALRMVYELVSASASLHTLAERRLAPPGPQLSST